jgi:hypothetical protein
VKWGETETVKRDIALMLVVCLGMKYLDRRRGGDGMMFEIRCIAFAAL